MIPSCLASVSRAAEQASDCLLICIDNSYCHFTRTGYNVSAESQILLSGVTYHSDREISLHKTRSHAGGKPSRLAPCQTTLETLLVYMNR